MKSPISHIARALALIVALCVACNASSAETSNKTKGSFAWGAEAGGSIDMSANDMSTIYFTAYFGYKRNWIKFIGVGAEIDIMLNNSCRSFPVYLSFKSNFRNKPSLLFMDLRGGISVNYLPSDYSQSGAYAYGGLGINLASGKNFASHISIGYTFKQYRDFDTSEGKNIKMNDVHLATVRLGITF